MSDIFTEDMYRSAFKAIKNAGAVVSEKILVSEAAKILGISVSTYYRRAEKGTLPKPIRSGRRSYVYRDSLELARAVEKNESEKLLREKLDV